MINDGYEEIDFPTSKVPHGTDYGVRIAGDSMEPVIPNNCIAFVRSRPAIENGEVGIFCLNGDSCCKRLKVDLNRRSVCLTSDNPKYEPIQIKSDDILYTFGEVLDWIKI